MTTNYQKVKQFMQLFKQEIPPTPIIPSLEVRKLRARLILEEALETIEALGFEIDFQYNDFNESEDGPNLVKVLDGMCDLDYVNKGLAIAMGVQEDKLDDAFAEVHRSNMSKMWSEEQLEQGKLDYPSCTIEHYGGGLYRLIYFGKVIKSPNYSPANLEQFLPIQEGVDFHEVEEGFKGRTIFVKDEEVFPYCGKCQHQPCTCGFMKDEP